MNVAYFVKKAIIYGSDLESSNEFGKAKNGCSAQLAREYRSLVLGSLQYGIAVQTEVTS